MGNKCPTGLNILLPMPLGPAASKINYDRLFSLKLQKYLPFTKTASFGITLE